MLLLAQFIINSTAGTNTTILKVPKQMESNTTENITQNIKIKKEKLKIPPYRKGKPVEEIEAGLLKTDLFTPIFLVEKGRWRILKKPGFLDVKNIHYISSENKTIITLEPLRIGKGKLVLTMEFKWKLQRKIYNVEVVPFQETEKKKEMEEKGEKEALSMYKAAYELFRRAKYREAERSLKELLRKYPESTINETAMVLLGHTLIKLKKYEEALSTLQRVTPTAYSVLLQAEAMYQKGDIEGALIKSSQSYYMNPSGETAPEALLLEGKALFKSGDCMQAAEVFKKVYKEFKKSPEAEEALFRLGEVFESKGCRNYPLAEYFYKKLIVEYPESKWSFEAKRRIELLKNYLTPGVPTKP